MIEKSVLKNYLKAGNATAAAKKLGREIAQPGVPLIEVCDRVEEEIVKNGAKLAFPLNCSLNEQAAHYTSPIDDPTIIPEEGLLKLDMGAHVDGYIADTAFTINLGEDKKYETFIIAAEEALEAAIEKFRPGTKLFEVGEAIENKIRGYGLKPINNLGGHRLKQFTLHAGEFVPNAKIIHHNQEIRIGDAYAIEPFATDGYGEVINGPKSYIYRFKKLLKKNVSYDLKAAMSTIKSNFSSLPFAPREVLKRNLFPKAQVMKIIDDLTRKGALEHYPIFIEKLNGKVSQAEHTVVVGDNETIITTN